MKTLFKVIILTFMALLNVRPAMSSDFGNERLNYVVTYKWGLIQKDAGTATLELKNHGNNYLISLMARSKPWADKIYQVRDTLLGTVEKNGFKPLTYTKIAHEDGKYSRDDLTYSYNGNTVDGHAKRIKINKKGEVSRNEKKLSATGRTFDMLSVFYFLRTIDYSHLDAGKEVVATVFSGSKAEKLTIKCEGVETIKLRDKSKREAYHIKFRFTTEGQKKSSDDIDAWISTDSRHIPLLVEGSLPVGKVKCFYQP